MRSRPQSRNQSIHASNSPRISVSTVHGIVLSCCTCTGR